MIVELVYAVEKITGGWVAKEVSIRCEGSRRLDIEQLVPFQDDIKTMDSRALKKLKSTILEQGFSEPIAVWLNPETEQFMILNGHQRHTALLALRQDGFFVDSIPISMVECDDEQDARKKILTLASQFGDFNVGRVEEFVARAKLDVDWLKKHTRLARGTISFQTVETEKVMGKLKAQRTVHCPSCGDDFLV